VCAEISSSGTEKGALPPRPVMGIGFFLEQGEELKRYDGFKLGDESLKAHYFFSRQRVIVLVPLEGLLQSSYIHNIVAGINHDFFPLFFTNNSRSYFLLKKS
jgi:hypothetical protein